VVYQDSSGRITDANPAAHEILGLSLDEMRGRTSLHPDWRAVRADGSDYPGEEHPAMRTLATGEPVSGELMGVYNPRVERINWIRVSTVPLRYDGDDTISEVYARFELLDDDDAGQLRVREEGAAP
jgi:PAS domain S-box-containing protein